MKDVWELYEKYSADVYRYLLRVSGDEQLAQELLSETFLSAILSLAGYRGDGDGKAWLLTIARNKWFDYLRKKRCDISLEELILEDCGPSLEDRVYRKQILERAQELLQYEDERSKAVIRMRMEGYSFYEIGKKLSIREGSARVIDFRVRRKVREQLEKEGLYEGL